MRIRLLPVVLFAAGLLLTVRVGGIWQELEVSAGSGSLAETSAETGADTGAGTGAAPAETPPADVAADPAAADPASATTEQAAATDPLAPPPAGENLLAPGSVDDPLSYTDQELELLQSLSKRRTELDTREQSLDDREAVNAATEKRIDDKLAELKQLQATIEGLVKQHDTDQEAQMKSLVKIYENMKPKDAAQIFEDLEMDVLLDVVEGMKERKVAPILALMNPAKAQEVTLELAQRRDLPLPK
jgi:flagellar motility protein MotE (MotC chaperone)